MGKLSGSGWTALLSWAWVGALVGPLPALLGGCGGPREAAESSGDATGQQSQAIVNGQQTPAGAFAAVGAVLMRGQDRYGDAMGTLCTGTLIAPDVVLSAGHCVEPGDSGSTVHYYFSLAADVARAGQHPTDIPGPTFEVADALIHPGYAVVQHDGLDRANDVSLLFLGIAVAEVQPSQILAEGEMTLRAGAAVSIVGYGFDGPPEARRRGTQLGVKRDAMSMVNQLGAYEMQVGDRAPVPQKCFGDSGGPTYVNTPWGERLAGITSRAYDRSGCMRGGIDTLMAPQRNWVLQALRDACADGRRVACGDE